jgi:hypothetical protein
VLLERRTTHLRYFKDSSNMPSVSLVLLSLESRVTASVLSIVEHYHLGDFRHSRPLIKLADIYIYIYAHLSARNAPSYDNSWALPISSSNLTRLPPNISNELIEDSVRCSIKRLQWAHLPYVKSTLPLDSSSTRLRSATPVQLMSPLISDAEN